MTLFVLDLSSTRITDHQLFALLAQVPPRSMILVEDVDRTRPIAAQAARVADPGQAREIFLRFFPGEIAAAEAFAAALAGRTLTMADLQGVLLAAETGSDAVTRIASQGSRPSSVILDS